MGAIDSKFYQAPPILGKGGGPGNESNHKTSAHSNRVSKFLLIPGHTFYFVPSPWWAGIPVHAVSDGPLSS